MFIGRVTVTANALEDIFNGLLESGATYEVVIVRTNAISFLSSSSTATEGVSMSSNLSEVSTLRFSWGDTPLYAKSNGANSHIQFILSKVPAGNTNVNLSVTPCD